MLNDAVAIVLYTVFAQLQEAPSGAASAGHGVVAEFLLVSLGSFGLGIGVGALSALLTKHAGVYTPPRLMGEAGGDAMLSHTAGASAQHASSAHGADAFVHVEVSFVLLAAYGSYVLADVLGLSGIISLFFCATFLARGPRPFQYKRVVEYLSRYGIR